MAPLNRRQFLRGAQAPVRTLELSCEQLYMKYADARGEGRLPDFLAALDRDLSAAADVRVTAREWLARQDFLTDVGPVLRRWIETAAAPRR